MAAVPVTISGVLLDKLGRTIQQVTLVGEATLTGVGVGGGPLPGGDEDNGKPGIWPGRPAHPIAPGGEPPSIWPSPGTPEHPIVLPPGIWPDPPSVGGKPPTIWPSPGHPEHPIEIPPPAGVNGPDLEVKVVWTPDTGWAVVLIPTGTAPAPSKK